MAETRCSACEKVLDVEPPKCPYCGGLQTGGLSRRAGAALRVGAVALGALMGSSLGRRLAASRAQARSLTIESRFTLKEGAAAPSRERDDFRARAAAAVAAVKREGRYRYIQVEDANVDGPRLAGQRVAVAGLGNWLNLTASPPHFALCTGWGSGASLAVDASALDDAARKDVLQNNFPPSAFLVRGVLRRGALGNIPGAASDNYVAAESIEDLGRAPDSGTKPFSDYMP